MPIFSYVRSTYSSWGPTALNPDVLDLYIEKIEGEKYFYENEWHNLETEIETFKVRF